MKLSHLILATVLCAAAGSALAAEPPGLASSVLGGEIDPNGVVPEFNGVPSAGVTNFDVPAPQSLFVHGASSSFCVSWQNNGYTGTVQVKYVVFRKVGSTNKVIQSAILNNAFQIDGGNGLYAFCTSSKPMPNSPGLAVLQGLVTYNTTPTKFVSSIETGIYIQ